MKTLDQVRGALSMGAVTRKEIKFYTNLDADIVDLCVDLLVSRGEIKPADIKGACTIGGCSSCGEDSTCHPRENGGQHVDIVIGKRPLNS